ncbi:hypothetical protein [Methylopila sp. M107]|uniref:hypothetical protein n=1 Tax=Methylopila sp. M107 TaxID=1101190 RepID=UPI0003AAFA1C|nr:hypothetical protein [Methylopila sp. M107]
MRRARPDLGQEQDAQSFVLRLRLDPVKGETDQAVPRLRIEHVNKQTVWHFNEIGSALSQLKKSLEAIVFGSAA